MRKTLLSLLFGIAVISSAFAQQQNAEENLQSHTVQMGETVLVIAKKYKITPRDIYEFNPGAVEGLSANSILQIPVSRQKQKQAAVANTTNEEVQPKREATPFIIETAQPVAVKAEEKPALPVAEAAPVKEIAVAAAEPAAPKASYTVEHEVKAGETLYRLSRNYNTTVAAIEKENASKLKNGLTVGLKLTITNTSAKQAAVYNAGFIAHNVAAGETLTGLSRKYNTTVAAISQSNKTALKNGLQVGQKLMIQPGDTVHDTDNDTTPSNIPPIVERDKRASSIAQMVIQHQVKTGETLVGLASQYNTTVDDIVKDNKTELDSGLQPGQVLKIKEKNVKDTIMAERQD